MARQRKPTALHAIEGTLNPTRHADRGREPKPGGKLGAPPNDWKAPGRALWYELKKQVPVGVGTASDRAAFEILVRLFGHVRASPECLSPAWASQLRAMLGAFGMTPAARATLSVPPPPKKDGPAADFFDDPAPS